MQPPLCKQWAILTLLTEKLNPTVSISAWTIKRPQIHLHSVLQMNKPLYDVEDWNEEVIKQRTQELFEFAVNVWPRPIQS